MNMKKAIQRVIERGCKLEQFGTGKGAVRMLHLKRPKPNGLGFWSAVDCLKKYGFRVN